VIELKKLNHT